MVRRQSLLVGTIHNVQRNGTNDNADRVVFRSNSMKDMGQVVGEVMKPVAHAHALCSVIRLALWYRDLVSKKREVRESTTKDSEESYA